MWDTTVIRGGGCHETGSLGFESRSLGPFPGLRLCSLTLELTRFLERKSPHPHKKDFNSGLISQGHILLSRALHNRTLSQSGERAVRCAPQKRCAA